MKSKILKIEYHIIKPKLQFRSIWIVVFHLRVAFLQLATTILEFKYILKCNFQTW